MPRKARMVLVGALHHIIIRGIEQTVIFKDDLDRNRFIDHISAVIAEGKASCFAWALLSNHVHVLVRTGTAPVATLMRRLLTGYAVSEDKQYNRSGHLFQNRYESILCEGEPYFLKRIRDIHLIPPSVSLWREVSAL